MGTKATVNKTAPSVKDLIATHRKAKARHAAAMRAIHSVHYPNRVHVDVPEIGPRCVAYGVEELDRLAHGHERQGLTGLDRIEFNKQMVDYREVLVLMEGLYQNWRKRHGVDAIEVEQIAADDEQESAWKALVARIRSCPRDIAEIARYFASEEASGGDFWRPREVLRAIAAAA